MDPDLGSALEVFKGYFLKYDRFVRLNPRLATEVEAIIRWSSYLIATRKSPVLSELLSSGANLLQLCNDIILRQANPYLKLNLSDHSTKLKTFLNVIQSLELLAEIYAREVYGPAGKWIIISVIQILKTAIKLVLLFVFEKGISESQPIVPLDRIHFIEIMKLQERLGGSSVDIEPQPSPKKSLVLKSSGRKMRSIMDSPQRDIRFEGSKSKLRLSLLLDRYRDNQSDKLTGQQLQGELLHIARPLTSLVLMGCFGTQSWIPYLTSLAMDVSSLHLVRVPQPIPDSEPTAYRQFSTHERIELGQRAASMLLYILRSPFFDKYIEKGALQGLSSTADKIPLVGRFFAEFVNYIPDWQKDYFRIQ